MRPDLPLVQDLVLIGGGHTHALVLRKWGMNPLAGVRVTVINPGPTAPYSGMLPSFVAGHYGRDDLDIDLVQLARFAGARVINGKAIAIDRAAREIMVQGRPPIAYDIASLDVGITSEMPKLSGFAEHGIPAKPLGAFAARWDAFRETTDDPSVAVIGGGVAGAELAMGMAHALRARGHDPKVTLIDRSYILDGFGDTARRLLIDALTAQGVALIENTGVECVMADGAVLSDGRTIAAAFVTGAAGARPHDWIVATGLDLHDGFVTVGADLRSSDPAIFAVGDCAHMAHAPRPKAGVYAVRQAPVLFDNIRAAMSRGDLRDYHPQKDYLKLVSLGAKQALAEKFGTARRGALLWRWKDRIDRKFMDQFRDLPQMDQPKIPRTAAVGLTSALGDKPMCGGCGAKVGRGALRGVLAGLPQHGRDDVQSVAGDDAAILRTGGVTQVVTTDHLRAFSNDPVVMTRIAAIHALGDIWAMGAAPQAATINVILPRMSADLQKRTLTEIMQSADRVLREAGAAIVGGHTSLGDEMTIGFTITGLAKSTPITIAGARAGDVLILTKPVGSGVIMATEMAGAARGEDVITALDLMCQSQAKAASILSKAHAMTDVTGFGLAGHLAGICEASNVAATLKLNDIPVMNGALELSQGGTRSTLFQDNFAGIDSIFGATGPHADLLFDPQTAGGLLAAVSPRSAPSMLKKLHAAGYTAALIGSLGQGRGIHVITNDPESA